MSPDCSCLHSSGFSCLGGGLSCSSLQTLVSPGDSRTSGQVPLCTRWPDRPFEYNLSRALPLFSHRQWLPPYMPSFPRWTTGALKSGHCLPPPLLPTISSGRHCLSCCSATPTSAGSFSACLPSLLSGGLSPSHPPFSLGRPWRGFPESLPSPRPSPGFLS